MEQTSLNSKNVIFKKLKTKEKIKYKDLSWRPKFDWWIIDEAHKKNQNIELIISFMRFYFALNNSVRFSIMSATIENDKMNFKRFFAGYSQFRLHMRGVARLKPTLHLFDLRQNVR
jgi:hypothetical protein